MISDEQRDKKLQLIKNQAAILEPSFDSVHIFATKYDPESGDTSQFNFGTGNWFSRYGQVRYFIVFEEAKTAKQGKESA